MQEAESTSSSSALASVVCVASLEGGGRAEVLPPPGLDSMAPSTSTHAVDMKARREERAKLRQRLEKDC